MNDKKLSLMVNLLFAVGVLILFSLIAIISRLDLMNRSLRSIDSTSIYTEEINERLKQNPEFKLLSDLSRLNGE